MYTLTENDIIRFESQCYTDEDGIMRWGGRIDEKGYGRFDLKYDDSPRCRPVFAHRIAMQIWGDQPMTTNDLVLHQIHGIENRNIVDVRFLRLGDAFDNMRDKIEAGNQKSKLTQDEVREIVRLYEEGESVTNLSRTFDVNRMTIWKITTGRSWSWLTGIGQTTTYAAAD